MLSKIKQNLPAIVLFLFFSSLYVYTAAPSVYDGDSGEIIIDVDTMGLGHPPGFPLYMLTGKLFTLLLPIKDVAYRLNIFSAILTTSAIIFVYYTLKNLGNSPFASLAASITLGLGRNTIWSNGTTARVYALSFLFAAILLFIFSKWRKDQKIRYLFWYSFVWGLSMGVHILISVMIVPFLSMLWHMRQAIKDRISILVKIILLAVLPFSQYIYLIFAYRRNAFITWGDLSNFNGFIYYILEKQYTSKILANTSSILGDFLTTIISLMTSEFTIIFFGVAIIGAIAVYRNEKNLGLVFISIILFNVAITFQHVKLGSLPILFRYIFIADLIIAILVAFGIDLLAEKGGFSKDLKKVVIFTIIIFCMLAFQLKSSYTVNNRRYVYIFEDFARNALLSIDPSSILIASDDSIINSLWYLQNLGERKDTVILSAGLLNYDWYVKNEIHNHPDVLSPELLSEKWDSNRVAYIINENIANKKIYTTFTAWDASSESNFDFIPVGNIYQVVLSGEKNKDSILKKNKELWGKYLLRNIKSDKHKDLTVNKLVKNYSLSLNNLGVIYANSGYLEEGVYFLEKSIDIFPDPGAQENLRKIKTMLNK